MLTLSLVLTVCVGWAQPSFPPVDEGPKDPSFSVFRKDMLGICQRRDYKALLERLDYQISDGSGEEQPSRTAFCRFWKLPSPDSKFWDECAVVLSRGGVFHDPKTFVAPYTFALWPPKSEDSDFVAVVDEKVPVYSKRSLKSPVLTSVSHCLLVRSYRDSNLTGWTEVLLPNAAKQSMPEYGFVEDRHLVGAASTHARFVKKSGRWLMTTFIGGE